MIYEFELKEKAIGKARPRFSYKMGRMYTPSATQKFEQKVKNAFLEKYRLEKLLEKPIKALIIVEIEPPKSISKKKRLELIEQVINYTKKPDIDNIAKIVLDGLNGVAYKDDSQIYRLEIYKRYGYENKIIVKLEEI